MEEANKTDVGTNCEGKAALGESEKATQREQQHCTKTKIDCLAFVCVGTRTREENGGARVCTLFECTAGEGGQRRREKGARGEKRRWSACCRCSADTGKELRLVLC